MNIADDIRKTHQDFLAAIEGLTPDQLTSQGSFGRWSAREVMLHIAMWTGECIKALAVWKTGHSYDWDYASDYLAYNEFWIKSSQHLSLNQVVQMMNLNFHTLANETISVPPEIWEQRGGVPKWLYEIAVSHSREHLEKMRDYRNRILHKISI